MKRRVFIWFAIVALLIGGGCTRVDFVVPQPVDKPTQNPSDKPEPEPEPTPEPEPEPEPEPTPEPTPDAPSYSSRVKWVASAEDLAGLNIVAGDTVVWRNGTYDGVNITLAASGTQTNPVVFKGEQGGKVIFTGGSSLEVKGKHIEVADFWWKNPTKTPLTIAKGAANVAVSHCAITGYDTTASTKDYKWVSIYGTNNRVSNCYFDDKRNMGTLLVVWFESGVVPQHTIEKNYFSRPYSINDGENGQETLRIGTSDYSLDRADCIVRGNYFYKCNAETEIVSNKSCGNLYEGNLFRASEGTLTLRHGNDCVVRQNLFLGEKRSNTGGVRVIGEGHLVENNYLENLRGSGYKTAICLVRGEKDAALSGYAQVKGAVVRGNTIVGCRYSLHLNYGKESMTMPVVGSSICDNTIVCSSSGDYAVYLYTSPAADITWSDNKIFGGAQKGISLPTLSAAPNVGAGAEAATTIERECGPKWKTLITK